MCRQPLPSRHFVSRHVRSGTMGAATGERLQKAGANSQWPPPSDFVWRFRGGRSNNPTNVDAVLESADMILEMPVLSGQWHPWSCSNGGQDDGDSDGSDGDGGGGGSGCRGCKKILRDEGRFARDGPLEPQGAAPSQGELSSAPSVLLSSPTLHWYPTLPRTCFGCSGLDCVSYPPFSSFPQ